jgi:hypothetical protein
MSAISKLYQDSHFRKEVHRDLTKQQQQAYLGPRRAKRKKTGRRRVKVDHSACEMTIRPLGPHQGLYCLQHKAWIKWISRQDLAKIQDLIQVAK